MSAVGPFKSGDPSDAQRAGLENIISDLRVASRQQSGVSLSDGLIWGVDAFDALSRGACDSALNTTLFRSESERGEYDWIADQFERLALIGRQIGERVVDDDAIDRDKRAHVIAYAILLTGHDAKWRQIAGRGQGSASQHHALLSRALAAGLSDVIVNVRIEGEAIETTVESLYARALLLDRLASGNLSPRQIEILDNWLAAWMPALMISQDALEGEACLCADLDDTQGLRISTLAHMRDPRTRGHRHIYLPIAPLLRQLDRAIEYFHQGLIFPGFGLGMAFRIEEHLGVIDYLSREFSLLEHDATEKSARHPVKQGIDVEVYFGMNDIASRAIGVNTVQPLAVPAARDYYFGRQDGRAKRFVETSEFAPFDPSKKVLQVLDVSESGLGLAMSTPEAEHVQVGDLAAIRLDLAMPVLLGMVSRKALLPGGTRHVIGINFISKRAKPLLLEYADDGETARPPASAIYVPGEDESGRGDSIVASESVYRPNNRFQVQIGEDKFAVSLTRIKKQGRGWKMAAFDVLPADK
ncbi:MAG: hypothetical protein JNN20_03270 [Betaproteobacteria bacterium]|nr:hypothetical protein [Betaproteobacteria bacterium]